jgi:hypothetical protein
LVVALIGLVGAVVGSSLSPFVEWLLKSESQEKVQHELDELRAAHKSLRRDHDDLLLRELIAGASQRRISFQLLAVDNQLRNRTKDGPPPVVELLGVNALGPLHQGRETLIRILKPRDQGGLGGTVRILLMNPTAAGFADREEFEIDSMGRIAAELNASLFILADIRMQLGEQPFANLEIRSLDHPPDRSLVMVDVCAGATDLGTDVRDIITSCSQGQVLGNNFSSTPGTRGLSGESFRATPDYERRRYEESIQYFRSRWLANADRRVAVPKSQFRFRPWPLP